MHFNIKEDLIHLRDACVRIQPMVVINCITFNHERYIRDALDGFVMQQTDFPFVAFVHDDASTDNTANIIREYAEKYPDIIFPLIESENQYSKSDGSLGRVLKTARIATGAKYIAFCEGDDYWTDPLKLQKQVDFLEAHQDYSMCYTNCKTINKYGSKLYDYNCYDTDSDAPIEDLILKGGAFCATNTIMVRSTLFNEMPKAVRSLYVGDYPLQMYMGYRGRVRYLNIMTGVYRTCTEGSWSSRVLNESFEKRVYEYWPKNKQLVMVMDQVLDYNYSSLLKAVYYDFMFWDCRRFGKYILAIKLWPKLYKPMTRYGFKTLFEILGYGFIKKQLRLILK